MQKLQQLYEGKAKKVYATEDPNVVIVSYKDDATAFNGQKKGTIAGKGAINNRMTNNLMRRLEAAGVPTHYIQELNDRETAVKKVTIIPLEVIVRTLSAGSFADVGLYFDPTHPTKAMADAAATVASQAPLLWLGAVAVGAIVPTAAAFLGKRTGNWRLWAPVAIAAALVGAVCMRVAFYNLGLSVFMFY